MKWSTALSLVLFVLPLLLLSAGCGGGCPELKKLDESAEAPGLVQLLFSVQCNGAPVPDLVADDFALTEDGDAVSSSESQWVVQGVTAALEAYTLLLIDVSDSIIDEGTLELAREVAVDFSHSLLEQGQKVSVAVFDGAAETRTVMDFTDDVDALDAAIGGISAADQQDGSTNLNGAITSSLEALDAIVQPDVEAELESVANLVVFTDGVDRAGRVTHSSATSKINKSDHEVFLVALVGEESVDELRELAKNGFFQASDTAGLNAAFDELITKLLAEVSKFYRLSYCSPLRSPRTTLKVTVEQDEGIDTISVSYPTRDFGPGCSLPEE